MKLKLKKVNKKIVKIKQKIKKRNDTMYYVDYQSVYENTKNHKIVEDIKATERTKATA